VHVAAPSLASFLLLTLALLALLGLIILRPVSPRQLRQRRLALQPVPIRPQPARLRRASNPIEFGGVAGNPLRAPPTFPDQRIDYHPPDVLGE
jgi:hypothetical protein